MGDDTQGQARARALWNILEQVIALYDPSADDAGRDLARRFLLEIAWAESDGLTTRTSDEGRGLWLSTAAQVASAWAACQKAGWSGRWAAASGLSVDALGTAAAALAGQSAWPDGNAIGDALVASDRFAAEVARTIVKQIPQVIPSAPMDRASQWADALHGGFANPVTRTIKVSLFVAACGLLLSWFPGPEAEPALTIVDSPTRRDLPTRPGAVQAIVIHTTGDTDLAKIIAFYTSADGLGPHYMIELDGTIRRFAAEKLVAWHCAIDNAEANLYAQGWDVWSHYRWDGKQNAPVDAGAVYSGYATWRASWPDLASPLDLVTGRSPNYVSVGIELQQPVSPGPSIFTDAQYDALAKLVADVADRHGVPLDRQHLVGHYDCSPMRRSTAAGGWDPGDKFDWARLLAAVTPVADATTGGGRSATG